MHFAQYVCGSTSMKLVPHLVFKVRKVYWQNSSQGPIIHVVMSLGRFSNFAILENFCNKFLRNYESSKALIALQQGYSQIL